MADAVGLAAKYKFDYISFKPCLIRVPEVRKETLLDSVDDERAQGIIKAVAKHLEAAKKAAGGGVKVLESVNLIAMLTHQVQALKNQTKTCHIQVFNSVVTPMGIFHCPAFRGVDTARIGPFDGYAGEEKFHQTAKGLTNSIISFDASKECDRIACFYNHVNWCGSRISSARTGAWKILKKPRTIIFYFDKYPVTREKRRITKWIKMCQKSLSASPIGRSNDI
jgi:hypothetical protein